MSHDPDTLHDLYQRGWADSAEETVGSSGVPFEVDEAARAIEIGGPGGTLILHTKQIADLVSSAGGLPDARLAGVDIAAYPARKINAGADYLGIYAGPNGFVWICSRAAPGDCRLPVSSPRTEPTP